MREILFRGKHNGVWSEGNLVVKKDGVTIITPDDTPLGVYGQVDPDTVGQYTGVTDRNGVKIFEGDIVDGGDFSAEYGYGVIRWEDGAFEAAGSDVAGTFYENYWGTDFEVIGNIHENPELLEGSNQT